jgi:flagellar basal body-associated protein FliL
MKKDNFFDDDEPLTPRAVEEVSTFSSNVISKVKTRMGLAIIIAIIISILAGAYFIVNVINSPKQYDKVQTTHKATKNISTEPVIDKETDDTFVHLDPMIIPLLVTNGKPNYLKLTLSLALNSANDEKRVVAKLPIIADNIQTFTMSLRAGDFSSTGNILYVKEELIKRVNAIIAPLTVKDVLFKDLVID